MMLEFCAIMLKINLIRMSLFTKFIYYTIASISIFDSLLAIMKS